MADMHVVQCLFLSVYVCLSTNIPVCLSVFCHNSVVADMYVVQCLFLSVYICLSTYIPVCLSVFSRQNEVFVVRKGKYLRDLLMIVLCIRLLHHKSLAQSVLFSF